MTTIPPTSNTLSSQQRSALVRTSKKLSKVLGDVPRMIEHDFPPGPELSRTFTATSTTSSFVDTESTWRKRKPTHLPPLLKLSPGPADAPDSPGSSVYHRPPSHRASVLSIAPSIISNAPSTASGSSVSDVVPETTLQRAKLERLRRKLGDEVPATAVFPTTPRTAIPSPRTPKPSSSKSKPRSGSPHARARTRTRSVARPPADDARSVTFSVSSDESVHTITFTAARVPTSGRPQKPKRIYQTGPLPPVPPLPAHLAGSSSRRDDDDAGLIRPRQKMAAGSVIGGADFKAARRAKREGRGQNGMAEPGELIEMVGFMH